MILLASFQASAVGDGVQPPRHRCNKELVKEIYTQEKTELMDAIRKHFVEKDTRGRTDAQFCGWLKLRHQSQTEARFEDCWNCESDTPTTGG
ncbi:MAG: hypothetical protein HC883_01830 [Bdellovibrionaceae bacterium]|nr:hypothetical protein [Pseudobdellovibrionaceae bacterium]